MGIPDVLFHCKVAPGQVPCARPVSRISLRWTRAARGRRHQAPVRPVALPSSPRSSAVSGSVNTTVVLIAPLKVSHTLPEDTLGARRLRPSVLAQIQVIDVLATDTQEPVRRELLSVGSHYCQFAGWLGQDTMDAAGARRYYGRAMDAAQEIGDADMITSVLSLTSHLAWSRGDAATAVGLAQAGQRDSRR